MLSFPTHNLYAIAQVVSKSRGHLPEAHCIVPRLYLTDYSIATSAQQLSRLGVTHVVSVLDHDVTLPAFIENRNRLHIRVQDHAGVQLLDHLDRTTNFIRAALEENATNVVLVHCLMGISRSATAVCAYLIATKRMKAKEAIEYVQSKRPIVCPNIGFRKQLETYATKFALGRKRWDSLQIMTKIKGVRASDRLKYIIPRF